MKCDCPLRPAQQTSDHPISLHDVMKGGFGEAAPQRVQTSRMSALGRSPRLINQGF